MPKLQSQDLSSISHTLDSIINIDTEKAIDTAQKLEKYAKKQSSDKYLLKAYSALAKLFYETENFNKSIQYFDKELSLLDKSNSNQELSVAYYNLGSTCMKLGKNKKAKNHFETSLDKAKNSKDNSLIRSNYNALAVVNEALYDYKKSVSYLKLLMEMNEGVYSNQINLYKKEVVEHKKQIERKSSQLKNTLETLDTVSSKLQNSEETINILEEDTLKKQQKIASLNFQKLLKDEQLKNKVEELKLEKQLSTLLIIGLSLITVLGIFVFFLLQSKKRLNKTLEAQKEKITIQNDAITHSIEYAAKIQNAALPSQHLFDKLFREYFVFFKPRDIVSGDFFFLQQVNEYKVFAAVDCTGHGVPGAFLSMLGIAFLNDIIRKKEVTQANQILNILREEIKNSLQQIGEKGEQRDGMDMAICVINENTNEMQYSGAHNPLIIIRKGELIEYKADRMPVGIHRKESAFTNHIIPIESEDKIYIYSDGFIDQLSEESKQKYKSNAFKALLLKHSQLSMSEQKLALENEFSNWKGAMKQIDDIVIIGVKI